jgi:hypothetical protein
MAKTGLEKSLGQISGPPVCLDWELLFDDFVAAVRELLTLQAEQWGVAKRQETDVVLRAMERKRRAKDALMLHQRTHVCGAG